MTERFVSIEDVQKALRDAVEKLTALEEHDVNSYTRLVGFSTVLEIIGACEDADQRLTDLANIIDRLRQNWPTDLPKSDPSASRSS